MTWQPIETAPEDPDLLVLVYCPAYFDKDFRIHIGRFSPGGAWIEPREWYYEILSDADADGCPSAEKPSHWMPLPEAPE